MRGRLLRASRPRILLFGTTTRTSSYEMEAGAPYFGVRFRPGNASLFVRENISRLTDTQVEVDDLLGLSAEEVLDERSFDRRRLRLESSLISAIACGKEHGTDLVTYAVSKINFTHGDNPGP